MENCWWGKVCSIDFEIPLAMCEAGERLPEGKTTHVCRVIERNHLHGLAITCELR